MITCENVTVTRDEITVFKHVGFTLGEGGLLVLRGPNGVGKTTLLRVIAGFITPTEGRVLWYNTASDTSDTLQHSSVQLAYVGHKCGVNLSLTVLQNLQFWAALYQAEDILPAASHYWGLESVLTLPCHMLSAGWLKRLALARLLLTVHARIWLLDEPYSNLDDDACRLLTQLLHARCEQGGIIIMASHDKAQMPSFLELDIENFRSKQHAC